MLRHARTLVALGLALMLAAEATAQERGRGRAGGAGFFNQMASQVYLAQAPAVREELKLSAEQQPKLDEIVQAFRDRWRELTGIGEDGVSREQIGQRIEQNREQLAALNAETEKKIGELLNADQKKRLNEISLQAAGVDAFQREDVVSALKITPEQKQKITQVLEEQSQKRREIFGQGRSGDIGQRMRQIREEAEQQVLAVLTEEQKTQWKQMQGKEFDLDSLRQRRRQ